MSLDPTVAAALVLSAGKTLSTIGELLSRLSFGRGSDRHSESAKQVIERNFDTLCHHLGDDSVKVLVLLEDGDNRHPLEFVKALFRGPHSAKFMGEFEYRLKFLCLLGLL
jgi:hypothetical protein